MSSAAPGSIWVGASEPTVIEEPEQPTVEDALLVLTGWLREPRKSREMRVEVTMLGLVCKLLESGQLQAVGRGRDLDDAMVEAFEDLGTP